jgi:cardiolipin synthase
MSRFSPQFKIYATTKDAWDGMFHACEQAEKSIYIEMYIIANTDKTHDFISLFSKKAQEGVHIVLLLDSWGSRQLSSRDREKLRNSGIEIRFFIKWFSFIHRKLIIIDDEVVFVGGVNLQPKALSWFDLVIKITNGPTHQFKKMFARTYQITKGEHTDILTFLLAPDKETLGIQIIDHFPVLRYFKLRTHVMERLHSMQKTVTFATPYLVPPKWFDDTVISLLSQNKEVIFLLPFWTDSIMVNHVNRYYASRYQKRGAKVYILPVMNHSKAMLVDSKEGMIGSGNIDNLSFGINSEIGVFFDDEKTVANLKKIFEVWQKDSIIYLPEEHGLKWYHKLLLPILWMLKPVL